MRARTSGRRRGGRFLGGWRRCGRAGDPADLADVLARGGLDLFAGGGGLEAPEGGDVAAHAAIFDQVRGGGKRCQPPPPDANMCSMTSEATILHADLDAFYASVEQRDDSALRHRPVIVGMGVVLAASYEAKACGVRTAMGGAQALRLCPQAIVVAPRMSAYSEASKAVF